MLEENVAFYHDCSSIFDHTAKHTGNFDLLLQQLMQFFAPALALIDKVLVFVVS